MYKLDHILVPLDLSEMDNFLIKYCNFLVEQLSPKSITFMHVMNKYDVPDDILSAFPDLDAPLTEIVKDDLQERLDEHFKYQEKVKTTVITKEGVPTESIVNYTREHNISLTLMGKKVGYAGKGSIVRRVLNITPSTVLLISETTRPSINRVLVRMDFSRVSEIAMKTALQLQKYTGAKLSCHHVYKLPIKYFANATPENEKKLKEYMEKYSTKEYARFAKKLNIDVEAIPCTSSMDKENEEAHILYNQALWIGADMIVIGSRIKSDFTDVILDNTSEKLADFEKNIPVLVVKDRNKSMGFLDRLFDKIEKI